MYIKKAYSFYFDVFSSEKHELFFDFSSGLREFFFNFKTTSPEYVQPGSCDFLTEGSGVLFSQIVLDYIEPVKIINDFKSCIAYHIPSDICDADGSRYKGNYTFDFDVNALNKEIAQDYILGYDYTPWKHIVMLDPDFFYLNDGNQLLMGSKDYKQVENWILGNRINSITKHK